MKHINKALAAILLVSYVTLSHFRSPEISDAIIIGCLTALTGYRMYLEKLEVPDIRKELSDMSTSLLEEVQGSSNALKADIAEAFKNRDIELEKVKSDVRGIGQVSSAKELQPKLRF